MLNGFDVAKWQGNIDCGKVPGDFVIVKATQSTNYVNPYFDHQYSTAKNSGKMLGVYHYAGGGNGAKKEAEFFINTVKNKIGEAILVLDWEGDMNPVFSKTEYAKEFLRYVIEKTGIIPFLYISKSVCRSQNWSDVATVVPLWVAQYPKNNKLVKTGYKSNPWTDSNTFGPWKKPTIFQYSSNGSLPGYSGALDLNLAYLTREEWADYARNNKNTMSSVKETINTVNNNLNKKIRVITGFLNIREKSNINSKDIGDLKKTDIVTVTKKENDFYYFEGWISSNVNYITTMKNNQIKVKANALNVRISSDKTSTIVGNLHNGSVVIYDKLVNGMYHISGWFSSKSAYVKEA